MAGIHNANFYSRTFALLLLCGLSFFSQISHGGKLVCEVSDHSPNEVDVVDVIKYIKDLGYEQCCQTQCFSSKCTTMHEIGEAAVAICGVCTLGSCYKCMDAAEFLEFVHTECTLEVGGVKRTGGYYQLQGIDQQFVVYNSADSIALKIT